MELDALQAVLPEFESRGAQLIAISPHNAGALEKLREQRKLDFPILVDEGNEVAQMFGVRFAMSDDLRAVYEHSFGLNLAQVNGDDSWTLPIPSRFIVDRKGVIRDATGDPDYSVRPEPRDLLPLLDTLTDDAN